MSLVLRLFRFRVTTLNHKESGSFCLQRKWKHMSQFALWPLVEMLLCLLFLVCNLLIFKSLFKCCLFRDASWDDQIWRLSLTAYCPSPSKVHESQFIMTHLVIYLCNICHYTSLLDPQRWAPLIQVCIFSTFCWMPSTWGSRGNLSTWKKEKAQF